MHDGEPFHTQRFGVAGDHGCFFRVARANGVNVGEQRAAQLVSPRHRAKQQHIGFFELRIDGRHLGRAVVTKKRQNALAKQFFGVQNRLCGATHIVQSGQFDLATIDPARAIEAIKIQLGTLCKRYAQRAGRPGQGHRLSQGDGGFTDAVWRSHCQARQRQQRDHESFFEQRYAPRLQKCGGHACLQQCFYM